MLNKRLSVQGDSKIYGWAEKQLGTGNFFLKFQLSNFSKSLDIHFYKLTILFLFQRTENQNTIATLKTKVDKLEKLCRALQSERKGAKKQNTDNKVNIWSLLLNLYASTRYYPEYQLIHMHYTQIFLNLMFVIGSLIASILLT